MATVFITHGFYRKQEIRNREFTLIKPAEKMVKGLYVTVDGTGHSDLPQKKIRIRIKRFEAVKMSMVSDEPQIEEDTRTDEEIIVEMRERFSVLRDMGKAAASGVVRGLIVSGPPGIGKSYGLERVIGEYNMVRSLSTEQKVEYGMEKGYCTPIHLYMLLYKYKHSGSVLVLDDMDSVLFDEQSLNLLKGALDSTKKRTLSWKSESHVLKDTGTPETYEFNGSVVFISNLDFERTRDSKLSKHLEALVSRCHYIEMGISNAREKLLRCRQIVQDGMLKDYNFKKGEDEEILVYMDKNKDKLREISLRMVTKIADLRRMNNKKWEFYANNTCLRRR